MAMTLKAARVNVGLSIEAAAAELNVSEKTLHNWEAGKTFPNVVQLQNIEKVYGVGYNDLIFLPSETT